MVLQNAALVRFTFGTAVFLLPIYLIAFISFLLGILLSALYSLSGWASSTIALSAQERQLNKAGQTVADLKNKIVQLELENSHLKGEREAVKSQTVAAHQKAHEEDRSHIHLNQPNFWDRLRYRLAF